MTLPKMGGHERLRILLVGGDELSDLVLSTQNGGSKLSSGLAEKVADGYEGRFEIHVSTHPAGLMKDLADQFPDLDEPPDVALLSVFPDVMETGVLDVDSFREDARRVVSSFKELGTYVFIANVSTVDPGDLVTNYHNLTDPPSLRAHKAALAIIDLSAELGISLVDADRLLAEMGAGDHVETIGRYSAEACDVIASEIKRILEDYGFFENRPLMAQAGKTRMK